MVTMNKLLLLALTAPLVGAALPPDVIEAANANATEKLYISVMSVELEDQMEDSCWVPLHADAKVLEVEESAMGKEPGDIIHLSSKEWVTGEEDHDDDHDHPHPHEDEVLDDSMANATAEMRAGHNATEMMDVCAMGPPPGPRPPPELYPGWCGWVYLNLDESGHMVMAIDGNSFVPAEDMSTCAPVEEGEHGDHDHDEDMDEDGHHDEDDHGHDHDEEEDHDHNHDEEEEHEDEEDDHGHSHDHDHDEKGEGGDPATCGEPCTTQGSCEAGKINVCHGGDTDECISADEWSSHCSDFGDSCGACGAAASSARRLSFGVAATSIVFMAL